MTRVKGGIATKRRHNKWLKLAKGYRGTRGNQYKAAREAVIHAYVYAYRDRRNKKRDFRRLWIARINAATRQQGLRYGQFINALKHANVTLDRKILAHLAMTEPSAFTAIVDLAKKQMATA